MENLLRLSGHSIEHLKDIKDMINLERLELSRSWLFWGRLSNSQIDIS